MSKEYFPDIPIPETEGELQAKLVEQSQIRARNIKQNTGDRIVAYEQAMVNLDFLLEVKIVWLKHPIDPSPMASE